MLVPALSLTSRVTLGQSFHFPGPQFHHLSSGGSGTACLLGVLWRLVQHLTHTQSWGFTMKFRWGEPLGFAFYIVFWGVVGALWWWSPTWRGA